MRAGQRSVPESDKWLGRLAGIAIAAMALGAPCAAAGFSTANVRGGYAFSSTRFGTCTDLEHSVGLFTFDGKGGIKGSLTDYGTASNGSGGPAVHQFAVSGTYSVNANGTGTMKFHLNIPSSQLDFVIDNLNSSAVAREIDFVDTGTLKGHCATNGVLLRQ